MNHENSRWKGCVLGMIGGVAGTLAMNYYQEVTKALRQALQPDSPKQPSGPASQKLWSLVGQQHKEGESATEAVGRILYRTATGEEPKTEETRKTLSTLVHWGYGTEMGGWYGFFRPDADGLDIVGGLAFGAVLWAAGDELGVPLLGLSKAPGAYPKSIHAETLGAHLAYGAVTAAATRVLLKVVP
jgi:hypothetical protein